MYIFDHGYSTKWMKFISLWGEWGTWKVFLFWYFINSFYTKPEKEPTFKKFPYNVSLYWIRYTPKLSYYFYWAISRRLNFMFRRFGTLCPFHLHRRCKLPAYSTMKMEQSVPKCRHIKIHKPGNHPKERTQRSEHGEILKPRRYKMSFYGVWWTTS